MQRAGGWQKVEGLGEERESARQGDRLLAKNRGGKLDVAVDCREGILQAKLGGCNELGGLSYKHSYEKRRAERVDVRGNNCEAN